MAFEGTALGVSPELRELDADCVSVDSVTRINNEFVVIVKGGFGFTFDEVTEEKVEFELTEATLTFGWPRSRNLDAMSDKVEVLLARWQETNMPLRLAGAVMTPTVLAEDTEVYLPIPRT